MTTHEQAVRIDTKLEELHLALQEASDKRHHHFEDLHWAIEDRPTYIGRRQTWKLSVPELARIAQARVETDQDNDVRRGHGFFAKKLAAIAEWAEPIARLEHEIAELDALYKADPWQRFHPCQTGNPHIHAGWGCAGLKHNSILLWEPQLSGLEMADAVAKLGPKLCTHCFPSAPVEYTQGDPDTSCPGSGAYVPLAKGANPYRKRWSKCPECEYSGQLTPSGYVRKHQPKAAA